MATGTSSRLIAPIYDLRVRVITPTLTCSDGVVCEG
jgi:hypothetical protein